jgi:hypothetical protein
MATTGSRATNITVGFGIGDVDDEERFEAVAPYGVKITDGVLRVDTPGRTRLFADGFWKYVDIDDEMSPEDDTEPDVADE